MMALSELALNFIAQGFMSEDKETYTRIMYDAVVEGEIGVNDWQFLVDQLHAMLSDFARDLLTATESLDLTQMGFYQSAYNDYLAVLHEYQALPYYNDDERDGQ